MPPRHGKSELTSRWFPAWVLSRDPTHRILLCSYAEDFASDWGRKVRDLCRQYPELGVRVKRDVDAASKWETSEGGGMICAGVGGQITGRGSDLLLIDDPIKNWEDAYSPKVRESQWHWWRSTARTRLEPGASVVCIMTRWHDDDLTGRFMRETAEPWTVIRLPALAEPGDPLGREEGAALCPDRYTRDALLLTKDTVGDLVWSGLYQQRPTPESADLFPRGAWRYWTNANLPRFEKVIASWDFAFKDLKSSDFVVGQVWGVTPGAMYLLEQVRGQWSFTRTCKELADQRSRWGSVLGRVYCEDKANGPGILDVMRGTCRGLTPVDPVGSKHARAASIAGFQQAGDLHLPAGLPWVADFVEEHHQFPRGTHDDQVDATSQAVSQVWSGRRVGRWSLDLAAMGVTQAWAP